jgi:hypothetical protein
MSVTHKLRKINSFQAHEFPDQGHVAYKFSTQISCVLKEGDMMMKASMCVLLWILQSNMAEEIFIHQDFRQ